jgi:hypothetical protein
MRLGRQWSWTSIRRAATVPVFILFPPIGASLCQTPQPAPDMQEQVRRLTDAINRVQGQIDEAQRELGDLKTQLTALQPSAAGSSRPVAEEQRTSPDAAELSAAVAAIRENESIHDTQIATLEQIKVESESKYPLKLSGLILMTGFVNTRRVDLAQSPTIALAGPGSTASTLRQTILGIDAHGPHLFGASSRADLRLDFDAGTSGGVYSGDNASGIVRMRTAHAELAWDRTKAFFSLDRPILNPDAPTSLTAVATPALAWSGNLWTWNPQLGVSRDLMQGSAATVRVEGGLIDVGDSPSLYSTAQSGTYSPPGTAEQSRWPGLEARIAFVNEVRDRELHLGVSGLFAPHRVPQLKNFNSWAGAIDVGLPISRFTQLTGSAYRGQALGGLGGGAYKDYVARTYQGEWYFRALDDSGGWVQWKQRAGERIEFNEAFGIDNIPAHQLRPFVSSYAPSYYNLARNRTITANAIYSPSAYLLFSLEYRRIASSYVGYPTQFSDIIGLAAGYKF